MSYYYEINKVKLQGLEVMHGLPFSISTRSWEDVPTSLDGIDVLIESSEPLDESILMVKAITVEEARILVNSPKYYKEEEL